MEAKLVKEGCELKNSKIRDTKELIRGYKVVEKADASKEYVDCRLYMGRSASASTVYCLTWVHRSGKWASGSGKAGGYGYDKQSAAVGCALEAAGFELSERIAGVGESAIREALSAVARAFGCVEPVIIEVYS